MTERPQLVDTSVLSRSRQSLVAGRLEALLADGNLWTCRVIDLEHLYSVRRRDVSAVVRARRLLPEAPITSETFDRAIRIMEDLADAGRHRHANPADCVIAASAQLKGLSVLHYDRDFDYIAEVANVDTEWVAPPGTLDEPRAKKGAAE